MVNLRASSARWLLVLSLSFALHEHAAAVQRVKSVKLNASFWISRTQQFYDKNDINIPEECDDKFGAGYIDEWKASETEFCASKESSIRCFAHPIATSQENFTGGGFCYLTNVLLDSTGFLHQPEPLKGSVKVACKVKDPLPWPVQKLDDKHLNRWLLSAIKGQAARQVSAACRNASTVITRPTVFISRFEPINNFHHFENVVSTFIELLLHSQPELFEDGLDVVFTDLYSHRFYMAIWKRIAQPGTIRFLKENPFPDGTCFKHAILGAAPIRSLYTYEGVGVPTYCRSLVLHSIVNWVHYLFRDTRPEYFHHPDLQSTQNADVVVGHVLWLSRMHFEIAMGNKMTSWQLARVLHNEPEIVEALQEAVEEWNSKSCLRHPPTASEEDECRKLPVYFEFNRMEASDTRWYPEQLYAFSRTNIFVSVHGAGMTNQIWLPTTTSTVIEVTHHAGGNLHYHNIASMIGQKYVALDSIQLERVKSVVTAAMDETSKRMYADFKWRQRKKQRV